MRLLKLLEGRSADARGAGLGPVRFFADRLGQVTLPTALAAIVMLLAAVAAAVAFVGQQAARVPAGLAKANGRIEIERVDIASKYPGRVARIDVKEGDDVARGQAIALMDVAELNAQLARHELPCGGLPRPSSAQKPRSSSEKPNTSSPRPS